MNEWLQSAVYYLIVFFISILLYFLFVLAIVHIKSSSVEKRKQTLRHIFDEVIVGYETTAINKLDKHRRLRTPLGIMVLDEMIQDPNSPDREMLRLLVTDSSYDRYILTLLYSKDTLTKIFAVKMIADLEIRKYNQLILKMSLHETENADLQYHAILTLSRLGDELALNKIFCGDRFTQKLTFRSLQEILKAYTGDKSRLYWILLDAPDLYIRRICIKRIGAEKIRRLAGFVVPYLDSDDFNTVIDAVRTLGQLEYTEALPKIELLASHPRWEIRSACMSALAQIDLKSEIGYITSGLFDGEWWVRRNAASAIIDYEPLRDIVSYVVNSDDRFAKEILAAAIKKKELLARGGML